MLSVDFFEDIESETFLSDFASTSLVRFGGTPDASIGMKNLTA